ncbi:hypothetical protein [Argonema antarcticum]|uniref:hypothetical protein n=1 Tax=Argonema antarcticum TaxID=2942763 RepID=UPI002013BAF0|nr:hypothetical protein [Argonema antarcticum]MCL1474969.1 hypothetical protein [Argonema antarcticum A004/B2]
MVVVVGEFGAVVAVLAMAMFGAVAGYLAMVYNILQPEASTFAILIVLFHL